MADIFNEINEDLRRDQLTKLWGRYSVLILSAAFLVVVGVAGWRGYEYWMTTKSQAAGDRYYAAVKLAAEGDHKAAEAAFAALEVEGFAGYPVLAGLRAAAEQAQQGDTNSAIRSYDALAARATTPPLLAGAARIRAAYIALDSEDPALLERRVAPLAASGPWRHSAREILAFAAWKTGDFDAARKRVDELLGDAEVPRSFTVRGEILSSLIQAAAPPPAASK